MDKTETPKMETMKIYKKLEDRIIVTLPDNLFETHPDNPIVKEVLAKLKAGEDPLSMTRKR